MPAPVLLSYGSATEVSCKDGICINKGFGILSQCSLLELIFKVGEAEWKRAISRNGKFTKNKNG